MEGKDDKTISPLFHRDIRSMFTESVVCVGCGTETVIMTGSYKCCKKRACLEVAMKLHDEFVESNIRAHRLLKHEQSNSNNK